MRRVLVAVALILPAAYGCDRILVRLEPEISPAEVVADFGTVFIGEESERSFTIEARGRNAVPLALPRGYRLPAEFRLTPEKAEIGPGSPATFRLVFSPLDPPGRRDFDFEILAPGGKPGRVRVHVRAFAQLRLIQTEPAPCLDFGTVMLGLERTLPMEITNLVDAPLSVDVSVLDSAFSVDPAHLDLGPRGVSPVNVRFFPSARGPYEADLLFKLCDECAQLKRCLKGMAAVESFTLEPDPLDFGTHSPGTTTCREISVRNTGDVSIYARDIRLDDGLLRAEGTFELRLGDILNGKEIEPGQAELCFTPARLGAEYGGNVIVYTDNQRQKVGVTGRGGAARIVAIPDHLDFGITTEGRALARRVVLTNVGEPTPVQVTGVRWTPGDGSLDVEPLPLPHDVGNTDLGLDVTYYGMVAGDHAGVITVSIEMDGIRDTIEIPVTARVIDGEPCNLAIRPDEVRFGSVHAGKDEQGRQEVHRQDVVIRNEGTTGCSVWDLGLDPGGSPLFTLQGAPEGIAVIPPGGDLAATVVYTPLAPSIVPDASRLLFRRVTDPGVDPQVSIPISAYGSGTCLRVEPSPVDFGRIPFGFVPVESFNLTNCGSELIKIGGNDPKQPISPTWNGDVAFSAASSPDFSVRGVPRLPFSLPAGGLLKLDIVYDPTGIGPDEGQLEIWLRNAPAPILVPVLGEAVDEPCGELCWGPQATCPAAQTTWVNAAVSLPGFARDEVDGENPPDNPDLTCLWEREEAPVTSVADVADPTRCVTTFRPDQQGDYRFKLTVADGDGYTDSCIAHVRANLFLGLWIETTWSAPDDVDLHVFDFEMAPPESRDILNAGSWFGLPWDCYYSNMHPYWDSLARSDDPHLDRDDEVSTGPENLRIDEPSAGHPYEIGVHWFASRNRNSEQTVTTRIYCGGALARTITKRLQRQYQAAWVATVDWNARGSCDVKAQPFVVTVIP